MKQSTWHNEASHVSRSQLLIIFARLLHVKCFAENAANCLVFETVIASAAKHAAPSSTMFLPDHVGAFSSRAPKRFRR